MFSQFLVKQLTKIIPKLSETEMIALRSGTVSLDRDIFKGKVNINLNKSISNNLCDTTIDKNY